MKLIILATTLMIVPVALFAASAPPDDGWETAFEQSGGMQTPRYEETRAYCQAIADASPLVHLTSLGHSPQGRDLMLVIADRLGRTSPTEIRAAGDVVLLIQSCIHAGESDGKDASLMLLRDLTVRGELTHLLEHVTVLLMPMFNVDGHERFGPHNRPNQNGPQEMGWRVTSRNLNLNRDYVKADTGEMQAWLRLYTDWLPDFFIDAHVSDGADFQYTLMYDLPLRGNLSPGLTRWSRDEYLVGLRDGLAADGWPLLEYGGFRNWHDPRSGMNVWLSGPRYSHGYAAIQNRPGLLLETHVLKPYAERVAGTYAVFLRSLELMNRDADRLRTLIDTADEHTASAAFRALPYPLTFRRDATDSVMIDFLGFDYDMVVSEVTGGSYPVFHRERPETFHIPQFGSFRPDAVVVPPEAYLIPPQWTEVIERLERHGVVMEKLDADIDLTVESVRFENPTWNEAPYEGHHMLTYSAAPATETRSWPAGTVVIDMAQRAAGVVLHLLDPAAPDALVRWGFFDAVFERKEYIESYILEPMLPDMLAADPDLAEAWRQAREENPALADNHWESLLWFYERSPWWDQGIGAYPVGWIRDRIIVDGLPLAP